MVQGKAAPSEREKKRIVLFAYTSVLKSPKRDSLKIIYIKDKCEKKMSRTKNSDYKTSREK